jgi:hypothetical protein
LKRWFLYLPLLFMPLWPAVAAVLFGLVGAGLVLQRQGVGGGWLFLALMLLGGVGQVWAPQSLYKLPQQPAYIESATGPVAANLLVVQALENLFGWNHQDGAGGWAQQVGEGFWRLPRWNPASGLEQSEFLTDNWYPITPGQTYTQSFYLRHDGKEARFQITFFTNTGHHPVPTQMEPVAPGVWRLWASYTAQEGDHSLRAIDFFNAGGDWRYLEVGWAKLEVGSSPSAFSWGQTGERSLSWRLEWWLGMMLLGFLVLQGGGVLKQLVPSWMAGALLLGMGIHLGYALWQLESPPYEGFRPSGLTPQPNLLGHTSVMLAGLVWLLGGSRWGGAALAVSGLLIWVTGSRAAFWGWLLLLGIWWWGLGRWRWSMLGVLVGGAFLLAWQPEWLGRLSQATTLDSSAQSRLVIWQVAIRAFLEYPWTGVGFGNFPVYYQIHRPHGALEAITGHAHNLWLHLVAEGGGLALLGFLLWLGGLLGWLIRLQAGRVLALVAVVLVLGLFDFSFFFAGVYYTLLLALGVCISRFDSSPQGRHRIPG